MAIRRKRNYSKRKTYEDLMCEIDNTLDIFKENVAYYLGADDNSIVAEMKEQEINFEEEWLWKKAKLKKK